MKSALVFLSLVIALTGCSRECTRATVLVDEAARAEFHLTLSWADAAVTCLDCPGPDVGRARCTATGAELDALPTRVVLKARGFHTVEPTGGTCRDGATTFHAASEPLPAFTSNDDYATGFEATTGAADFERLAVSVPSEAGVSRVVKFLVTGLGGATPEVYFQHTGKHPLHYRFARQVLGQAVTQDEFTAQTYGGEGRANLAGSLVVHPARVVTSAALGGEVRDLVTLEFFPSDDLSPRLAAKAHRLLEERLGHLPLGGRDGRLFYAPATTTHELALNGAVADFAGAGALWLTRTELLGDLRVQYLNAGKGCGTVHVLTPEQLSSTPLSFRDLLVLTRLPNEVPLVGGTITEELQTPLAHVNVAARTRHTPNLALLGASTDPRIAPLVGKLACLEVQPGSFTLREVTLAEAQAFWATLVPPEPVVPTSDLTVTGLQPFARIGFADARAVGVKAANIAELSHLVPANTPDGFAVPFSYFKQHMLASTVTSTACSAAQTACVTTRPAAPCAAAATLCQGAVGDGLSLDAYAARLLQDPGFQADTAVAEAALAGLRQLIETAPLDLAFGTLLDAEIQRRWGTTPIKLRSSTNAEDLPNFSGAGLYTSYGATLGHAMKPPQVQIRKTWASVWNFAAWQERAFWNIDHLAVVMGVAVHPSFPEENCNGVLITQSIANPAVQGHYVNVQLGEEPVTNPTNGALPEVDTVVPAGEGVLVLRDRFSSLSPHTPLMTDAELDELYDTAMKIQLHFATLYAADAATLALDLEFKRVPPNRQLIIKQVRPYSSPR